MDIFQLEAGAIPDLGGQPRLRVIQDRRALADGKAQLVKILELTTVDGTVSQVSNTLR